MQPLPDANNKVNPTGVLMRKVASSLPVAACALAWGVTAWAGDVEKLPASGTAKFQISEVQWAPTRDIALGDAAGLAAFEFLGITRNTESKSWFDRMTEHCSGQAFWGEHNPAPGTGTCLLTDLDGDQVLMNFTLTAAYGGTKEIVGGTGKYAGITGQGTFGGAPLRPPAKGMDLFLIDVALDFAVKSPTQ